MTDDLSKKVERLVKRLEREGRPSPDDGMGGDGNYLEAATLLRTLSTRLAEAEARNAALVEEAANMAKEIADQYVGYMSRIEKAIRALASDAERDALAERDARIRAEEREWCAVRLE